MSRPSSTAPATGRQGPGPIPTEPVAALDLALARRSAGLLPGDRLATGVGAGTELAQLREYQPGDDVRHIDAAATARTGVPHVRMHVPERLLTTWIVLDVSASMAFGTAERLKSDVAEGACLVIGRLAVRRGGRLALLTSGTTEPRFLEPRSGRGALAGLRRVLDEGVAVDGETGSSLADSLQRLARLARRPGLVVVISDFRGGEDWSVAMRRLGLRHSLLAVEVRDPREDELPAVGRLLLVDPETGREVEADSSDRRLRERFAARAREERSVVAAQLRAARADHSVVDTQGDWLRDLGRRLG